ncbi:MAG: hypothetical protein WC389_16305 [Lutibacter sp.]|jgi:predicted RecB family endonuclease
MPEIDTSALDNINKQIDKSVKDLGNKIGVNAIKILQTFVSKSGAKVTSQLYNSFSKKVTADNGIAQIELNTTDKGFDAIEGGTMASNYSSKAVNINQILRWLRAKGMSATYGGSLLRGKNQQKRLAFLIARNIVGRGKGFDIMNITGGTKQHKFMDGFEEKAYEMAYKEMDIWAQKIQTS